MPTTSSPAPPERDGDPLPPPPQLSLSAARWRRAAEVARERIRAGRAARDRDDADDYPSYPDMEQGEPRNESHDVPYGLRVTAAWGWRLLVLAAVGWVLLWLTSRLAAVMIPLAIALLLSALLSPAVRILRDKLRFPPSLASGLVLVTGVLVVVGTLTLVVTQIVDGAPALAEKAGDGIAQIQRWLRDGPLNLSTQELDATITATNQWVIDNRETLTTGAMNTATAGVEAVVSAFLVLFVTFFFLRDGKRLWRFTSGLLPRTARRPVYRAGIAAGLTLVAYVRATVIVAFIDAVGIGIALVILDVEFAFPLAALVFLASFIPIVGATLSGAVAVLVALVDKGLITALIVLAAVIVVQQLEGHVLQPLIMGRAVSIHPLAVIVALAAGVVVAGIIGALVAVPLVAVVNTAIRDLRTTPAPPPPDAVIVSAEPTP